MELEDQVVALTVLQAKVKEELDRKRAAWLAQARPKQRSTAMIGDEELGSVSWRKGAQRWALRDPEALLGWAMENAPHLVDYAPHVPEHHVAALKKNPVTEDGEVIPGFEVSESPDGVTVKPAADAEAVVARAVRSGALAYADLLELES